MTSPLPPNFNYYNGSKDSSVFVKQGQANTVLKSPFIVESADRQQKITLTSGSGTMGIQLRNDVLDPDAVSVFEMNSDGQAIIQTVSGTTKLLDPIVQVGNTLQNATFSVLGPSNGALAIQQTATATTLTNSKVDAGIDFYTSTNAINFYLSPKDKDASLKVFNRTFHGTTRNTEIGLLESGNGFVRVNGGGTEFNIVEPTVRLGDGLSGNPQVLVSGLPGEGRVYDTRYNKVAARTWELYVGPTLNPNTYNYNIELSPGKYQMQVMMRLYQSLANPIVQGDALEIWVQKRSGVTPNQYRNFSEIHIRPAMITLPDNNKSNEPTFCSGLFEVNEANEEWAVWIVAKNNWYLGDEGASAGLFFEFHRISAITDSA